ncbi:hypothetical protein HanIR_Chr02g0054981 [Helianthus annuus]|nr:hypothetical protein HanIR_Chr02g0054981 [Helianthus annuus]
MNRHGVVTDIQRDFDVIVVTIGSHAATTAPRSTVWDVELGALTPSSFVQRAAYCEWPAERVPVHSDSSFCVGVGMVMAVVVFCTHWNGMECKVS